jgi:hypothetical protein
MTYTGIYELGASTYNDSGMYGIYEYVDYSGYDVTQLYNQLTDNDHYGNGLSDSFTFEDYKNEIDAGRVVMVHIEGHSMLGYGYNDTGQLVTLHDTWTLGSHSMTWGGSYSGDEMTMVTVLELTGGEVVPEPTMLVGLASMIPVGLFLWRRRRRK